MTIWPSLSLVVLVMDFVRLRRGQPVRAPHYVAIAIAALILYAGTLGFLPNVYRLGFLPIPIAIAALIAIALAGRPAALLMLIAFIAYDLHLLPSRNFIDYLIDPLAAVIAIVWCGVRVASRLAAGGPAAKAGGGPTSSVLN